MNSWPRSKVVLHLLLGLYQSFANNYIIIIIANNYIKVLVKEIFQLEKLFSGGQNNSGNTILDFAKRESTNYLVEQDNLHEKKNKPKIDKFYIPSASPFDRGIVCSTSSTHLAAERRILWVLSSVSNSVLDI